MLPRRSEGVTHKYRGQGRDLDRQTTGIADAERMYEALVRAGQKPTFIRYWGEGHVAVSELTIRDQWNRIRIWFRHYLRDEPPTGATSPSATGGGDAPNK